MTVVGAVDWGGTWIRVALEGDDGRLAQQKLARPATLDAQLDALAGAIAALTADTGRRPVLVALGIAGLVRGGKVESAANLGINKTTDVAGELSARTTVPTVLINDTQAAVLAEAGPDHSGSMAMISMGTGIGGAIVSEGVLIQGRGAAGDFGHMVVQPDGPDCPCGGRGCLEQMVSGRVLDEQAAELAGSGASPLLAARRRNPGGVRAADLVDAAATGEAPARAVLARAADFLAAGMRGVLAACDPDVIALSGTSLRSGTLFASMVDASWSDQRPRWNGPEIRYAQLGDDAGLAGAALLGLRTASAAVGRKP